MNDFMQKLEAVHNRIGAAIKMVLATSQSDRVTARMMSCILVDGCIYFQTDKKFLKYKQLIANPNVALCIDNIQIEGISSIIGHPLDRENAFFIDLFKKYYRGSFDKYSALPDEVLIKVEPAKITLWEYENGKPYREFFDRINKLYTREYYEG